MTTTMNTTMTTTIDYDCDNNYNYDHNDVIIKHTASAMNYVSLPFHG
jgi:hypothetical protein